jgi:hypothetical protein
MFSVLSRRVLSTKVVPFAFRSFSAIPSTMKVSYHQFGSQQMVVDGL